MYSVFASVAALLAALSSAPVCGPSPEPPVTTSTQTTAYYAAGAAGLLYAGSRLNPDHSNPVPEPATVFVLGVGAAALVRRRRRA